MILVHLLNETAFVLTIIWNALQLVEGERKQNADPNMNLPLQKKKKNKKIKKIYIYPDIEPSIECINTIFFQPSLTFM